MTKEKLTSERLQKAYEDYFSYRITDIDYDKRYSSWDLFYKHFNSDENSVNLTGIHLAFYLASWGMFRGSSELLNSGIKKYNDLTKLLIDYKNKGFEEQYNAIEKFLGENDISATQTLITKIMLGSYANTPAIDQFFNKTARKYCVGIYDKDDANKLSIKLNEIFDTSIDNGTIGSFIKNLVLPDLSREKILDGIFFQIGKDL